MTYHADRDEAREAVVEALQRMVAMGLNKGRSGNVSVRANQGMLITPTGMHPDQISAADIVQADLDGTPCEGQLIPSSEWRMHADLYISKPQVNAVVHCHSPYATILAAARKPIPPVHYMVAGAGGREIPLADYATFGTADLSANTCEALSSCSACLLANHGQIAIGPNLEAALKLAELVEELAHCYWGSLAIGGPTLLSDDEMDEVVSAFDHYGQQKEQGE